MKFLSLILATLFISNTTFAYSNVTSDRLNSAFDRLNYDLSVNWDGQDVARKNSIVAEFESELASLEQMGLTESEILNTIESRLIDNKLVNEFRQTVNAMVLTNSSSEEIARASLPFLNASFKTGANYRSRAVTVAVPAIAFTVAVVAIYTVYVTQSLGRRIVAN